MTIISFFWPYEYRNGKKTFENSKYYNTETLEIDQALIDITSINDLFSLSKLGRFLLSQGQPLKHTYWKLIKRNNISEYYASPGVLIYKDELKLYYFMIPTFRKLRLDYQNEYFLKINFDQPLNLKIAEESLFGEERKIICV